jgi:GT2 family glycosyltransferase
MVKSKYPEVQLVEMEENLGFAKANNIGAQYCSGEYLLLLNPDTLIRKQTLQECVDFLEEHPKAGAVGVKMHDGGGQYLPESKRGFPGPWTAFCKITGLNNVFPTSKRFNYYYLGHLAEDQNHEVDVLTGAFMMMDRDTYLKLKGLDEDFFMYGEDIDLCYRLHARGFQNYYLASSSIIHFKGESTSKHTVKYIKTFYNAMSIYAKKHYNARIYKLLSLFIQAAIYGRAAVAIVSQRLQALWPPMRDFIGILLINYGLFWLLQEEVPSWIDLWPVVLVPIIWYVVKAYSSPFSWWKHFITSFVLFICLGVWSIFIPHNTYLLIGGSALILVLLKIIYRIYSKRTVFLPESGKNQLVGIISDQNGEEAVMELLDMLPKASREHKIFSLDDLEIWMNNIDEAPQEIIFDPRLISWNKIVQTILYFSPNRDFRIISHDRNALITSLSKNRTATIVTHTSAFNSFLAHQLQYKRLSDNLFSCFVLLCFPYFLIRGQFYWISGAIDVLKGNKTWVGFSVPTIKLLHSDQESIFSYGESYTQNAQKQRAQLLYAQDYSPFLDWNFLFSRI